MYAYDSNSIDPFSSTSTCRENQQPSIFAQGYPRELTIQQWNANKNDAISFGVVYEPKITKIGTQQLGQVAGLAFDSSGNLVIFHRANKPWTKT